MTEEERKALDALVLSSGSPTFDQLWNAASTAVKEAYRAIPRAIESSGRLQMGQPLAPNQPAPNAEFANAADVLRQIIEKQGLTGQIQPQLLPGMITVIQQKLNTGTSVEDLLKTSVVDIAKASKVYNEITLPTESTTTGTNRLGVDPLNPNIARLENGSIVNTSSGIGVDINGNVFRVPTQAAARSAGEEAASWASAAANQAQAEASRAAVQRQQDIDAAVRQGRVYDTGQGFVLTPTGNVYDPREVQASLERNQISRDQLKELNRSNLATEAGRAEERQITKDYNATQARLREAEIAQTGAYQQGQLQQGQRRLDLETWVAQQNAAARAEENRLSKEKYIAEVLRNPADWIARSFQMSGQASPVAQTTQADLINRANQVYAASPTTYVAPQTAPGAPGTPMPQQAPAMAYGSDGLSHYNAGSRLGGFVNDRMAVVGDPQRDGGPNPEIIYNPTGAPISVTPMRNFGFGTLATYANGTPNSSRMMVGGTGGSGTGGVPMISRLVPHYADGTWVGWTPGEGYTVGRGNPLTGESQAAAQASNVGYQAPAATSTPALNPIFYPAGVVANPVNPNTGRPYTPADVSMGKLSGPAYDWYDPAEGGYGYVTGRTVKPATTPGVTTGIAATPGVTTGAPQPSTGMGETRLGITAAPAPVRTQEEIQAQAEAGLSGRLRGLFGNTPPKLDVTTGATSNPFEPSGITPIRMPFNLFTPASLNRMTPDELTALRTYLAAYNVSLDDALTAVKQSFTPPSTRRGRLV